MVAEIQQVLGILLLVDAKMKELEHVTDIGHLADTIDTAEREQHAEDATNSHSAADTSM